MPVTVHWGRDRFCFDLPPPDTKLAAIRNSIAAYTQLAPAAFAIVHDGAVCADDNAPISVYHLRPNSALAIVANTEAPAPFKNTEHAQIAAIQAELNTVNTALRPAHHQFIADLAHQPRASLTKEHLRLSELLLQALLRFDAIVPERDWATARAHRKAAVKDLQSLLDQLDSAWAASA
ncbi:unnamed protein product [Cyclocybe aegerita]|uniref:BAG domain-containing protein n=1 Tax=Cyclocybe aegerita TaxID=1973307 RepID=A0A8S0XP72_CYCAE|nr:unnamed protein product [Cyclocybe aegerita]